MEEGQPISFYLTSTDIEYIEICSADEDDEGQAEALKRRSYQYRVSGYEEKRKIGPENCISRFKVVMVRQDARMDMRGRCSAGQKVCWGI